MAVLTDDQRAQYEKDGYLLVSGLIPDGVSERAEVAMWKLMGMDPEDPSTVVALGVIFFEFTVL
ncbi:MAG: hypothetical protein O7G87_16905 [bacterium]|nr:hypothetical protein [bacterium]